jgi:hypothetical protein
MNTPLTIIASRKVTLNKLLCSDDRDLGAAYTKQI